MSLVGVVHAPGSRISRAAAADALLSATILILGVICAFAFYVVVGLGGLIPIFLVGSVPLGLVTILDVLSWRRITGGGRASLPRKSAGEAAALVGAGIPLLLFGGIATLVGLSAGGPHKTTLAFWSQQAAAYLVLTALGTQVVLLLLTLAMRRNTPATDRGTIPDMPQTEGLPQGNRLPGAPLLAVLAAVIALGSFWASLGVVTRGGWYLAPIFIAVGVVFGQGSRLAWCRRDR